MSDTTWMDDAIRKAGVLIEALGYIRSFRDKLTVVKLGGSAMEDPDTLRATLQAVVAFETVGIRPVLIHGGGKPIDRAMAAAGLTPRKIAGRRYTDRATLDVVVRVLTAEVNAGIVAQIRRLGGRAVAMHTGAAQALFGEKLVLEKNGDRIDLGEVGKVTRVDAQLLRDFCDGGIIPVIPSLAADAAGNWLNVNADTAAAAVAAALKSEKLVFLTDTPGVLRDRTDPASLVRSLDEAGCQRLVSDGVVDEGMLPKIEACLDSLRAGVKKTHIIDGRLRHSLLLEIFTEQGIGTEIR